MLPKVEGERPIP